MAGYGYQGLQFGAGGGHVAGYDGGLGFATRPPQGYGLTPQPGAGAYQIPGQPGYKGQPMQPGFAQPGYAAKPGAAQPGFAQPGYGAQPGFAQPGYSAQPVMGGFKNQPGQGAPAQAPPTNTLTPAGARTSQHQPAPASTGQHQPAPTSTGQHQPAPASSSQQRPAAASSRPAAASTSQQQPAQPAPASTSQHQPAPASSSQHRPAPASSSQHQPAPASSSQHQPAVMDKFNDLHKRADDSHKAYGTFMVDEVKEDWAQTKKFVKAWHGGTINAANIQKKVPKFLVKHGEKGCLSGVCLEVPCIDSYAPNVSGCCCCHPWYSEKTYDFLEFFDKITPQLHTGDVILCSWIVEDIGIQRCMMHSKWSHVGIIYRPSDCPEILTSPCNPENPSEHPSRPCIAQFIMNDGTSPALQIDDFELYMKDYLDKHSAVKAFHPDDNADTYSEFEITVRFLHGVDRTRNFYQCVENVIQQNKNKTYGLSQASGIDLCQANPCCFCLKSFESAEVDPNAMMCAEFVAAVYQELGLINPDLNPNEFIPPMFDSSRHLWLRKGASLSMQHSTKSPETLEDRKRCGYKSQVGFAAPSGSGRGYWGVDTKKPVAIKAAGDDVSAPSGVQAPAQNTMQQHLLNNQS